MWNKICNSRLCSHFKWVNTLLHCISELTRALDAQVAFRLLATKLSHQIFHRCLTLRTVLLSLVSVFTTPTAAGCEEPTHEELRHTRLESTGYSLCDPETQAPNTWQAGVCYRDFETHLLIKQGPPESCPCRQRLGRGWVCNSTPALSRRRWALRCQRNLQNMP